MRNSPSGVMVFAAGFGTRMQPLTKTRPKPLIKVGDTTLLDHTLDLVGKKFGKIVVNTHYLGEQIQGHLDHTEHTISAEPEILDTGGGLKAAAAHFSATHVFTSNSDAVWSGPNPFSVLLENWQPNMKALLLCAPLEKVTGRIAPGDFDIGVDQKIRRKGEFVYLGVQIIALDIVKNYPKDIFSLNEIWDELINDGSAFGCTYDGLWCDVGKPENIITAEKILDPSHV